jgi:hypothetical protein
MADKKEVSILLLGIVAILAIVGLVLLFTSPAATGKAWFPPPVGPEIQAPSGVQIIPGLESMHLSRCPDNQLREREQGNIRYDVLSGHMCNWFYCGAIYGTPDPRFQPVMACAPSTVA